MRTAVANGVREGIDQSTMQEMIQRVVQAIREHGGTIDPSVYERLDVIETRLERHRRRIRWLERLAHWRGWFRPDPSP